MNQEQSVVTDFNRLLNTYPALFKGLVAVMDEINALGSMKNAVAESQKEFVAAEKEHAGFLARAKKEHDEVVALIDTAKAAIAVAEKDAAARIIAAKEASASIALDAEKKASEIIETADAAAKKETLKAQNAVAALQNRVKELTAQIDAKTATIEALTNDIAALTIQHTEALQRINNLKSMLGCCLLLK